MDQSPESVRALAHDLRNLLTAIRGHAELALRAIRSDSTAHQDVAQLMVVTSAAFELVDQLGRGPGADMSVVRDLDDTLLAWKPLFGALLPASIRFELQRGAPGAGAAISRPRLERVLLNLVGNARDAMPDGGALTIETAPGREGNVVIRVSDTGPGFSMDALQHLFELGYTTRRERGGTGIGLATSHRLVMDAGGALEVSNGTWEGAVVTVVLPAVPES
jgi:signal transduction histidine kinase